MAEGSSGYEGVDAKEMKLFIWSKLARAYLWLAKHHYPYWMQYVAAKSAMLAFAWIYGRDCDYPRPGTFR